MKPVRLTIFYGVFASCLTLPFTILLLPLVGWNITHQSILVLLIAFYLVPLCRWAKTDFTAVFFPLLLLVGTAFTSTTHTGFIFAGFCVFAWIRSGICLKGSPVRAILAESITATGWVVFLLFWWSSHLLMFPLAVLFFFLVQSLYFLIVVVPEVDSKESQVNDSFERARAEVERLLAE